MRLRFHLRELFLIVLCVALGIACWRFKYPPSVHSCSTGMTAPDKSRFRGVYLQVERLPFDYAVQHRVGSGAWRTLRVFPKDAFSACEIIFHESAAVDQVSTVTLLFSGETLFSGPRDRMASASALYISAHLEHIHEERLLLEHEWTDPNGKRHEHAFRLRPAD